jgi:hypothetical protein
MTWYDKLVFTAFAIFVITGEWLFVKNLIKEEKGKRLREAALDDRLGFYLFLIYIVQIILAVIYIWIKE